MQHAMLGQLLGLLVALPRLLGASEAAALDIFVAAGCTAGTVDALVDAVAAWVADGTWERPLATVFAARGGMRGGGSDAVGALELLDAPGECHVSATGTLLVLPPTPLGADSDVVVSCSPR